MLAVISPAKSIDMEKGPQFDLSSEPKFQTEASNIVEKLKMFSPHQLEKLMKISPKLAELNYNRFQEWTLDAERQLLRQALFAFRGDVYAGIDPDQMTLDEVLYLEDHLRILSGLYGILHPMDRIQAYRLEMGSKVMIQKAKHLYDFWGDKITTSLNNELSQEKTPVLVNLASNEYFKVVQSKNIQARIITPVFKDFKNEQYKIISFFAKKARGRMLAFLAKNQIHCPEDLIRFDYDGYYYNEEMSDRDTFVFIRG